MLVVFLAVFVFLAVVIAAVVWLLRPQPVAYESMPDCAGLQEASTLQTLVADPELRRDDFAEREFWEDRFCEWQSEEATAGTRGFANVLIMRNDNTSGTGGKSGDEIAEQDLADEIAGEEVVPAEGIGEEAYAWYEDESQWGCVATRLENVFLRTCYDAAQDFFDLESISEEEAISGAEEISAEFVELIVAHQD